MNHDRMGRIQAVTEAIAKLDSRKREEPNGLLYRRTF